MPHRPFDAAIFDYDGVLVVMDHERAASFLGPRSPLSLKALHRRWEIWCAEHMGEHPQAQEMWRAFWRALGAELTIESAVLEEICDFDYMSLFHVCPDALDALAAARRLGLRIGVLSNSALPKLSSPSAPIALAEVVDVVRVPGRGAAVKPDREAYLDIARKLGAPPERCLFFDDEPGFVEAAREVGMTGYLVSRGPGEPSGEAAVVRSLSGLRALVEA